MAYFDDINGVYWEDANHFVTFTKKKSALMIPKYLQLHPPHTKLFWRVWWIKTLLHQYNVTWASCQIRKIAGCACAGNAGNVFLTYRLQRKPQVSDPGMHHGTCVTHVPWCMSESLIRGRGENAPGIPGACATRNFAYLARGPLSSSCRDY